ncbi:MAG: BolA/IbaG family iron-sulfur metabolism protein [Proteobacteria bacterium]|nr:BolA/IbaG family iron-sulfur metabolism protein [Pseudomonadota bacterium]MCL2308426.1 BolA/IbaG family iron-sulfur metabolism protein [Pseudomonadota bacterium]
MVTPESVRQSILEGMECDDVQVRGDGRHFEALIVAAAFEGLSRIKRHQLVYKTLGSRMDEEVHALSMTTLTPAEWDAAQQEIRARKTN